MRSPSAKIPVQVLEGSKIKNALMQMDQSKGKSQLYIYETDTSRKPKYEFNLIESVAEPVLQDQTHTSVLISSSKDIVTLVFDNEKVAEKMIMTFNAKSDISHDIDSMKMLNEQVNFLWPYPNSES